MAEALELITVVRDRFRSAYVRSLTRTGVATPFSEQDTREQLDIATFQLQSAKAAQQSAKAALDSSIDGINTVIQTRAQLDNAKWELEQTKIRAPSDGYVSTMALRVDARALQTRAAMSFIPEPDIMIIGTFSQNGFQAPLHAALPAGVPVDEARNNACGAFPAHTNLNASDPIS